MSLFRPYFGRKPFLFISYAHKNSEKVLPVITALRYRENPYLIWYDEGIDAGGDWASIIARSMNACHSVLFFRSKESFASGNCLAEIQEAERQRKTIYCIALDDTEAPSERVNKDEKSWAELMKSCISLPAAETVEQKVVEFLKTSPKSDRLIGTEEDYKKAEKGGGGFNGWIIGLIFAILLLIGSIGTIFAIQAGCIQLPSSTPVPATPVPTPTEEPTPTPAPTAAFDIPDWLNEKVLFPDTQQEKVVRNILQKKNTEDIRLSDMYRITEYSVYADRPYTLRENDKAEISESGQCFLNRIELPAGNVKSLSAVAKMTNLSKLELIKQPLTSISGISDPLMRLTELNLSCSDISSLKGIGSAFPNLQALNIMYTPVRDLTDLNALEHLRTVYVSSDMLPLALDPAANYKVKLIK